ncbi:recombinase family protein [Paenibacillus sp. W2I17]|uniref:recombinase family protein n=1 Tax=Paenibacillus sp. W2I17 TaxID=3042311 RepID=UPI00278A6370|nr:recombinase family protein [Paenibacillus sp. W2I17]MDQ0660609.1 site-specific DNA recombinase [Paenibacillus sp. W2I17]
MQRAAIYVRVSSKKESQKDSPEHQESLCRSFCQENELEIVKVYKDQDSGTSIVGRPDVQRMIEDAENGEFDAVIFASLSRFSRDSFDALLLKRTFHGALRKRLVSIEDLYDTAKGDNDLMFNVVSAVNQKMSEQTSTASRRGIQQSALKGNFTGSFAPYGYEKANIDGRKTLVIDQEAAEVVKMIFDLYVNRKMGEKAIVNYLNSPEVAIPSPRQKGAWGITTIQRILQNEVYMGFNVFSKYKKIIHYDDHKNLQDRRKKMVQQDKEKWLRTDFKTHEAIIEEDLFNRVKEVRRLRSGGTRGSHKQPVNVFRKIIFCKHCGSAMVTMSSKMRGKKYQYLMCSRRRRTGVTGCENGKWVPYQEMRDELIAWVGKKISEQLNVDSYTDSVINQLKSQENKKKNSENEIKKIQKQIEQNRELLFKLRKLYMLEELDDVQYKYDKDKYETKIAELEEKLEKIQSESIQQKDYEQERLRIQDALNELITFSNYEEVEKVRAVLSKLIKNITVDSEGNIDVYSLLGKLA